LFVALNGYECRVMLDFTEVTDHTGLYAALAHRLGGGSVPSVAAAIEDLRTAPLRAALDGLLEACRPVLAGRVEADDPDVEAALGRLVEEAGLLGHHVERRRAFAQFPADLAVLARVADALDSRPPAWDQAWLAVWAAGRAFPSGRSGLRLEALGLEGGEHWARVVPLVERYAAPVREWARSRGSAAGLRRLLAGLLEDPEGAALLAVHDYGGVTWFDRDAFRALGRGLVAGGMLGSKSKAVLERAAELVAALARAEDRSGYKLDRLLGRVG
jgi:hypothetical protein